MTKFPFGSVVEVRFLEGAFSLEGSSRKALRPGGEDLEIPSPTRQGLHNWGLNGPGWETQSRPSETPLRESSRNIEEKYLEVESGKRMA